MNRSKSKNFPLYGYLGMCLVVGCLSWGPATLGSAVPGCPAQVALRAEFETAFNRLDPQPQSLISDEAFQLAMRDGKWILGGEFGKGFVLSKPLEAQFRLVAPQLLTPVLEYLLADQPKSTQTMRQKFQGFASDAVVIVVHTTIDEEAATAAYLEKAIFQNLPTLALVSDSFWLSEPRLIGQLSTARYSQSGELRDIWIDADEVHLMGGAFGDCLTTATAQALEQMLESPHRHQAVAHLHLEASSGWRQYLEDWQNLPTSSESNELFQFFGDQKGDGSVLNKALDPFEFVEWRSVASEPSYYELKLRRLKDSKIALVRLYGFEAEKGLGWLATTPN